MKTCLIVSPNFPPSTLAGVHRARHLVKHLPAHGWRAKVVCVDPKFHTERLDPALAGLVPPTSSIIRVGALPVRLTGPFGVVGDVGLRGLWHIRQAIAREMEECPPDLIMITGSPYFPMLLARWIKRQWQIPVILDFQDPWVSRDGATKRLLTKAWVSHRLAVVLEPWAVRGTSFITSVSERQNEEMLERYPWLDRARLEAIPIGGDPEDFDALRHLSDQERVLTQDPSITLSYVGTALPRSGPVFRALFRGIVVLRHKHPEIASNLLIRCVGTSNQPNDVTTLRVLPIAQEEGVASCVVEEPARIPFLDALQILSTTHANLMIGSDEPHYTASKIYPGLMSGRPFVSIFHRASSAHTILSRAGGGIALAFETQEEIDALPQKIAEAMVMLATDPTRLGRVDPAAYEDFTAHAIAGRFAAIFDRLRNERLHQKQECAA